MTEEIDISGISDDKEITGKILSKEEIEKRRFFLKGKTIGISISESDDLRQLGMSIYHLRDAMIEVARYILAAGGSLAYGGDMRPGGFTELMFDLLKHYRNDEVSPAKRFTNFLAWPISNTLSQQAEVALLDKVTFKKIAPPKELEIKNLNEILPAITPEELYIWAKCLTEMRSIMEDNCVARVFIGGKSTGFKGKCPGILEEILIAIEKEHPVFLVGAFGGITNECIKLIDGKQSQIITDDFQLQKDSYKDFFNHYNSKEAKKINFTTYQSTLSNLGFEGLSRLNNLSIAENKRLAITPHLQEIVYLILKGLNSFK